LDPTGLAAELRRRFDFYCERFPVRAEE